MAETPMGVSVVIPSYQRTSYLRDALRDLARQDLVEKECLVVLQTRPSRSELEELRQAFQDPLRVYLLNEANANLARNVGLREAQYEIVLFLDDDVRINDPCFLRRHAMNFNDPTVSGVYGQVLETGQEPEGDQELGSEDKVVLRVPPNYNRRCRVRDGGSGNLSLRRDWAIAAGGMDANFTKGARREEAEFNFRYTKKFGPLIFDPEASLQHLSGGGGSRAWGHVRRFVPMHHIAGHWYFLLASIENGTLSLREIAAELRHIGIALLRNPKAGYDIIRHARNLGRAVWGLNLAVIRLLRGRRQIQTVNGSEYQLLLETNSDHRSLSGRVSAAP